MKRICPFQSNQSNSHVDVYCAEEGCRLWVNVVQNRVLGYTSNSGERKFPDPDHEYRYEGCGLIQVVPWNLMPKRETNALS